LNETFGIGKDKKMGTQRVLKGIQRAINFPLNLSINKEGAFDY
jgi:hypothetical protein